MSQAEDAIKLSPVEAPPIQAASSGGGDGDARLAAVEARLAAMEAYVQHLATKEDIQSMKSSLLIWGMGILIAVSGLVSSIISIF